MLPLRLLLAVLGGLALWLAFPGYDLWPLAIVGCGVLAVATVGVSVRAGLVAGLLLGLAWYGPMFTWASTYAGTGPWVAMTAASALYPAALGGVLAWLQRDGQIRPVVGAAAWVLMEWGRSVSPFGGFPWARLGFSQADSPMLAVVRLVAVPGLGFLVALTGGLLALAAQHAIQRPAHRGRGLHSHRAMAAGALLAACGLVVAPLLIPRPVAGEQLRIAAVQGDIPPDFTRTLTAPPGTMLRTYTDLTHALAAQVRAGTASYPDLVIWPEGASDLDPLRGGEPENSGSGTAATRRIMSAVDDVGAPVVLGAVSATATGAPQNLVLSYLPGTGLHSTYAKIYLAPFGEVMPLRPLMRHLSPWVDRITDFVPGTTPGMMPVPVRDGREVNLGLGICFEVVVDPAVRDVVAEGADLLVVPTSNAWFGPGDQSAQHLAASRVRAVEYSRSVVHISNVGISGLITPDGTVHEQTGLFTQAVLQGDLPLRTERTLALQTGPWLAPGAAVVVLVGVLRRRPRRRPDPAAVRLSR